MADPAAGRQPTLEAGRTVRQAVSAISVERRQRSDAGHRRQARSAARVVLWQHASDGCM